MLILLFAAETGSKKADSQYLLLHTFSIIKLF